MHPNKSNLSKNSVENTKKILLHGNIGNHLFQFAAGLNEQKNKKKLDNILFLDTKEMSFKISSISIFHFIKGLNKIKYNNFLSFKFKKYFFSKNCQKIIEPPFNSIKNFKFKYPIFLDGYFQNISWYKHTVVDVVKYIFKNNYQFYNKINQYDVVLNCRGKEFFLSNGALDQRYYLAALKKLKVKKKEKIKIIGEDHKWMKELFNIIKLNGYTLHKLNLNSKVTITKVKKDFFTITKSKKLIIPNSSFSWWAATCRCLFNKSNLNKVCMPDKWYPKHLQLYGYPQPCFKWKKANAFFTGKSLKKM